MPVITYQRAVRTLQPMIVPIFESLQHGLDRSANLHAREGIRRETDSLYYRLLLRILRPDAEPGARGRVPLPGHSEAKQAFYRQETLPGFLATDNLVLSWTDTQGVVDDPLSLARPIAGDFRRDSLLLSWMSCSPRRSTDYSEARRRK